MIMTAQEREYKKRLIHFLKNGNPEVGIYEKYPYYAAYLEKFDINLTDDPNVTAYTVYEEKRIVINRGVNEQQVSVVIRHELLHNYLKHNYRLEKHVGERRWGGEDPVAGDIPVDDLHQIGNIAADFEISNRGYTKKDKQTIRNLMINDRLVGGLITEDSHKDWRLMTVEQLMDELERLYRQDDAWLKQLLQANKQMNKDHLGTGGKSGHGHGKGSGSDITTLEDIKRALEADKEEFDKKGGKPSIQLPDPDAKPNQSGQSGQSGQQGSSKGADQKSGAGTSSSGNRPSGTSNGSGAGNQALDPEEQARRLEEAIEAISEALDKIKKNPGMSEDEKKKILEEIYTRLTGESPSDDKTQDGETDDSSVSAGNKTSDAQADGADEDGDKKRAKSSRASDTDTKNPPSKETQEKLAELRRKLSDLSKKLQREAAIDYRQRLNPDFNRDEIDQSIESEVTNITNDYATDIQNVGAEINRVANIANADEIRKFKLEKAAHGVVYNKQLFLNHLDRLIAQQVQRVRQPSYARPSRRASGTNVLLRGKVYKKEEKKPLIVVYFDRSGSWQVDWKTKAGDDAINMLKQKYVRNNKIDLLVRYFGDYVSDDPTKVGGGTSVGQGLLDDIANIGATNVIILTDSDMESATYSPITIAGGVFFLFCDGESPSLVHAIHGRQLNEVYRLDYNHH